MSSAQPLEAPASEGRVPAPPPQRGGAFGLVAVLGLLLVGGGLIVAASLLASNDRAELGMQILGGLVLVPGVLGALFVVPAVVFGWRNEPGVELCWTPIAPNQPATLSFDARRARHHGVWLCLDVHHPFGNGPHAVVSTLLVAADGQALYSGTMATSWGFSGDPTGATHTFVGGRRSRYLDLPPSVVEFDRVVAARPTGRFRALSLLHRIRGLRPGQHVTLQLTVEPPAAATELRAHAFVALSR